ncbi:UNVERIFIED_CONTAM: hypothetical protein FKN15_047173 [Acipenser sinensis]
MIARGLYNKEKLSPAPVLHGQLIPARKMLDIIENILDDRGFKVMRVDGTVSHLAQRERRITKFKKNREYSVFLLTTQVGGLGLNLTAANRVVIFDPCWNPARDDQAVDRVYRIGQKKAVVIYSISFRDARNGPDQICATAHTRILLTGTPVQNNLKEMWALFNVACQETLLGTYRTFKKLYEDPISKAREKNASPHMKSLGLKMSESLTEMITPYYLRRTKEEVQKNRHDSDHRNERHPENKENHDPEVAVEMPLFTRKNDFVIWLHLSPLQEILYEKVIYSDKVKECLETSRSPLSDLNTLKKICDHPRLLSAQAYRELFHLDKSGIDCWYGDEDMWGADVSQQSSETLIQQSGKLPFLISLLEKLREEGNRTLVFSQSRKMLDIIENILDDRGFKVMRVDGTVSHLAQRERRITKFKKNRDYSVFLLTTQVGSLGLNLTAANRVVIFDPCWNPATDDQAVDRVYRIGQKKAVVIYRLITCGTVEEKIYRRQVFKNSLIRQATGDEKNPVRYFNNQELKELFILEDTQSSSTQIQLQKMHAAQRQTDKELDAHIAYLHSLKIFGISDHNLLFSEAQEDENETEAAQNDIRLKVEKAQGMIEAESQVVRHHGVALPEKEATKPTWNERDTDMSSPEVLGLSKRISEMEDDSYNASEENSQLTEEAEGECFQGVALPEKEATKTTWDERGAGMSSPNVLDLSQGSSEMEDDSYNASDENSHLTEEAGECLQGVALPEKEATKTTWDERGTGMSSPEVLGLSKGSSEMEDDSYNASDENSHLTEEAEGEYLEGVALQNNSNALPEKEATKPTWNKRDTGMSFPEVVGLSKGSSEMEDDSYNASEENSQLTEEAEGECLQGVALPEKEATKPTWNKRDTATRAELLSGFQLILDDSQEDPQDSVMGKQKESLQHVLDSSKGLQEAQNGTCLTVEKAQEMTETESQVIRHYGIHEADMKRSKPQKKSHKNTWDERDTAMSSAEVLGLRKGSSKMEDDSYNASDENSHLTEDSEGECLQGVALPEKEATKPTWNERDTGMSSPAVLGLSKGSSKMEDDSYNASDENSHLTEESEGECLQGVALPEKEATKPTWNERDTGMSSPAVLGLSKGSSKMEDDSYNASDENSHLTEESEGECLQGVALPEKEATKPTWNERDTGMSSPAVLGLSKGSSKMEDDSYNASDENSHLTEESEGECLQGVALPEKEATKPTWNERDTGMSSPAVLGLSKGSSKMEDDSYNASDENSHLTEDSEGECLQGVALPEKEATKPTWNERDTGMSSPAVLGLSKGSSKMEDDSYNASDENSHLTEDSEGECLQGVALPEKEATKPTWNERDTGRVPRSDFTYQYSQLHSYQCCHPIRLVIPICNEGGDYNPGTGVFTCRLPGLYYFTFQTQVYNMDLYIKMVHNGHTYLEWNDSFIYGEDNVAFSTLILLKRGDTLHLEMYPHKNGMFGKAIFSGFLLY